VMNDRDARRLHLIDLGLSPQEADVVSGAEAGERGSEAAARLGISQQAVYGAKMRGFAKLANLDAMG